MLKTLAVVGALVCAPLAHAESFFQIEAGLGVTSATKVGDGIYYSQGFSHDTPNGSWGGRFGIRLDAFEPKAWRPGLRFHLTYMNFGKVKWSSMNPQDAADFDGTGVVGGYNSKTGNCNDGNCGVFRRFDSTGGLQAIALTLEPYWNIGGGWTAGFQIGPAVFRSTWTAVATAMADGRFGPAGTQETLARKPVVQLGGLAGISLEKSHFAARLDYLYAPVGKITGSQLPSGTKGAWMLSLNYVW